MIKIEIGLGKIIQIIKNSIHTMANKKHTEINFIVDKLRLYINSFIMQSAMNLQAVLEKSDFLKPSALYLQRKRSNPPHYCKMSDITVFYPISLQKTKTALNQAIHCEAESTSYDGTIFILGEI